MGAGCVSDCGPAARNELKLRRCGFQQAASKCINSPLYTISEDSYEDVLDFKFADLQRKTQKEIATIRVVGNWIYWFQSKQKNVTEKVL